MLQVELEPELSVITNDYDKEKYDALVDELTTQLNRSRTVATRWEIGKAIIDFMDDAITPIKRREIRKKIVKSTDMSPNFWHICVRFYCSNPNGEYTGYPWWFCGYLLDIKNRSTRKILLVAYDNDLIRNRDTMRLWSDIIRHGEIRTLSPLMLSLLKVLQQGDETAESLTMKTGVLKNSITDKISSLNNLYGYNIVNRNHAYRLIQNDSEREKFLSYAKLQIKECTKLAETRPNIEEAKKYKKRIIGGKINDYDFIYQKRIIERKSWKDIAKECGVSANTLRSRWKNDATLIPEPVAKNHIVLSDEAKQNIIGLLLGDGSLIGRKRSAYYVHADKNPEYIKFLDPLFTSFGFSPRIRLNVKNGKYFTNKISTLSYDALLLIYEQFYLMDTKFCPYCDIEFNLDAENYKEWQNRGTKQNGRKKKKGKCLVCPVCEEHYLQYKIVPDNIQITPTMLKRWFEGDGSCSGTQVVLCTDAFRPSDVDLLIKKFQEVGIECRHDGRRIQITKKSEVQKFFEYIGLPDVECYAYKWCTDEELQYQRTPIDWSILNLVHVLKLRKARYSWDKIGEKYGISGSMLREKVKSMVSEEEFSEYERHIVTPDEINERRRKKRASRTDDERAVLNAKRMVKYHKKMNVMSDSEKSKHNAEQRKNQIKWRASRTPAQREEINARRSEIACKKRVLRTDAQKAECNTKQRVRYYKNKLARNMDTCVKQPL